MMGRLIWLISASWRIIGRGNENSATIMLKLILKILKKVVQKEKYVFFLGLAIFVLYPFLVLNAGNFNDASVTIEVKK